MTVKELKSLLRGLPSDMQVVLEHGQDTFITVCKEQSLVIEVEQDMGEESALEAILLLVPCTCSIEQDVKITEPNLNKNMNEVILFKYTSASRPELFFRGLDSIVNNLSNKENYWVICTFDLCDLTMFNPQIIERLNTYKNLSYYFGSGETKTQAINRNLDKLPAFDIIVNFSDDQQFLVSGFDDIIRSDFREAGGTDWFIHYPDSHAQERLATLSIMGYDYFKRTNTIYHPAYINVYSDNHAQDEAKHLGRYKFINKTIFDHFHPAWGMAEMDEQYLKTENKEIYQIDHQTYLRLKKELF